ncbi:hypothetical protein PoB_003259900 [Plakobranchus ocellatus]|uniref:Uncharacterized protein n=1 Tax=Plakobranchus ocellatus TaxID=259542 RepID=A0AAV4AEL6_9GAST|nr:hypothetical protein PoB_003259900 [Plakobranchus ocellatus]
MLCTKTSDFVFYIASPQQGDVRLSGPPSGQGAGGGARTYDRRVPADLREDSLAPVPPTPQDLRSIIQDCKLLQYVTLVGFPVYSSCTF